MSTQIQIIPPSDITVGTTAIQNGTDGRILFQEGGVVQQDSALHWDNTNKRLGVGTTTPSYSLDVNSNAILNGISIETTGLNTRSIQQNLAGTLTIAHAGSNNNIQFQVNRGGTPFIPLFIAGSTGHVGIGANSAGARLDVRAQGALSTDIAFRVRNSGDTQNIASIGGNGDIMLGLNSSGILGIFDTGIVVIGNNAKSSQYGISIGTNAGKNQDSGERRNVYIGMGAASQGTNATATHNIGIGNNACYAITTGNNNVAISGFNAGRFLTTGSNNVLIGTTSAITTADGNVSVGVFSGAQNITGVYNTQIGYAVDQGVSQNKSYNVGIGMRLRSSHNGSIMIGSTGAEVSIAASISDDAAQFHFRSTSQSFYFNKNTNVVLRSNSVLTSGTHFEAAATNTLTIHNGTAPVANIADAYAQYSADITAGNAAPHFRTENGSIIKLYQETTGVAAAALVGGGGTTITDTDTFGGYTLQQIAQALKNLGILA